MSFRELKSNNTPVPLLGISGRRMYGGKQWHYLREDIPVPAPVSGDRMII